MCGFFEFHYSLPGKLELSRSNVRLFIIFFFTELPQTTISCTCCVYPLPSLSPSLYSSEHLPNFNFMNLPCPLSLSLSLSLSFSLSLSLSLFLSLSLSLYFSLNISLLWSSCDVFILYIPILFFGCCFFHIIHTDHWHITPKWSIPKAMATLFAMLYISVYIKNC